MTLPSRDVVLLLGAPGAGKGTQARFLSNILSVPHLATGDVLREHRQLGTPLGLAAQAYMDRGDLVPDELVVDMVVDRLDRHDSVRGVLLDGFPRTLEQATALDQRLIMLATAVRAALYLEVPRDTLIERLAGRWMCANCQATYHERFAPPHIEGVCDACGGRLSQRQDDRRDVVENRVAVYLRDTLPVVDHYAQLAVLHRANGDQAEDAVRAELCMSLGGVISGERRRRWHLFIAHPSSSDSGHTGRTLCGKIVHRPADRAPGALPDFAACPCHTCRRTLRSHGARRTDRVAVEIE